MSLERIVPFTGPLRPLQDTSLAERERANFASSPSASSACVLFEQPFLFKCRCKVLLSGAQALSARYPQGTASLNFCV